MSVVVLKYEVSSTVKCTTVISSMLVCVWLLCFCFSCICLSICTLLLLFSCLSQVLILSFISCMSLVLNESLNEVCFFSSRGFGDRHRVPLQSCPSASQGFPHYRQNWRRYALLATLSTTLEFIYCLFQTNTVVTRSLEQKRCSCRAVYLCIRYVQLGVSGWGSDAGWEERDVCPETPHPNQPPYTHRRWASVSHCRWVSPVLLFMSHLQIHLDFVYYL